MKKLFFSTGIVIFVGVVVVNGTTALFRDTETSSGNTFTAGAIDLFIDNESYYNGQFNDETSWSLTNIDDQLFFYFEDVKPGDWGEDTISLHVDDNDSWLCMDVQVASSSENGINNPEAKDGDVSDGPNGGELHESINFIYWADDGDNVLEDNESASVSTSIFTASSTIILSDSSLNIWSASTTPLSPDDTLFIGTGWCFGLLLQNPAQQDGLIDGSGNNPTIDPGFICDGSLESNRTQTDSLVINVSFKAIQSRNNAFFLCSALDYPNVLTTYEPPEYIKYYPSLEHIGTISGLNDPAGIAVRGDGVIFVADYQNDQVKMYDSSFNLINTIGSSTGSGPGEFNEPWDIAFDSSSYAYITDTNNQRVQVFDINGDYIREFPAPNSSQGIAINGDNYVYVSGRKPEVFDIFGNSLGKIPVPNDRYPRNIAIDMQNGVHFSNYGNVSQSPGEDFYRYDLRNTISLNKPNGLEIFERRLDFQPSFIDVDSLNRVWIADHSNGKVHVYDYYEEWFMQSSFSVGNSIYLTSEDPVGLEVAGDYLYITSHISDDLKIYEITNSPATTSPDTTPPELLFIEISTTTTAVKMSVNAHDVLSELSTVQYWLRNDSADWNIYFTGDLIEAANLRATIFESFPVAGVWKINRVTLHDTAGNSAEYYYGTDFVHDFLVP